MALVLNYKQVKFSFEVQFLNQHFKVSHEYILSRISIIIFLSKLFLQNKINYIGWPNISIEVEKKSLHVLWNE